MRIEITERNGKDLNMVDKCLEEFIESVEKEYEEAMERAINSGKAKMLGLSSKIVNHMPEFISHTHYIDNNRVVLRNTLPFNKMAEKIGSYKKMENGLKGYLKVKGFDCDIKIMKDIKTK